MEGGHVDAASIRALDALLNPTHRGRGFSRRCPHPHGTFTRSIRQNWSNEMHRKMMLSTAAVGLMLASGLAYAQSPAERKEEPKRTEDPANASRHGQGTAQEHG